MNLTVRRLALVWMKIGMHCSLVEELSTAGLLRLLKAPKPHIGAISTTARKSSLPRETLPVSTKSPRPDFSADAGKFTAAIYQEFAVEANASRSGQCTAYNTLAPRGKATNNSLRMIWPQPDQQAQTMIVTADYSGSIARKCGPIRSLGLKQHTKRH